MMKCRNLIKQTPGNTRVVFLLAILAALLTLVAVPMASGGDITPTRTSTAGSHEQLRSASPGFQNFVIDRTIAWVPFTPIHFAVSTANDGGITTTSTVVGAGNGTPSIVEINTSGILGVTTDADDEAVMVLFPIPNDCDLTEDIRLRALWSNSESAGTGTLAVVFTYEVLKVDTSTIGSGEPDDACDTDGAAVADKAANVLNWTSWSTIDGSTITGDPGDDFLAIKAKIDLTTIADATVYGIQIQYYRKWLD